MIIHSVTPIDMLLYPETSARPETMPFSDGLLEGVKNQDGFTISRVISTNPKVFLDNRYAPGQIYHC
jgi:hypothetical protein